jgi:tetratricopeptide (TPR) repeat protein
MTTRSIASLMSIAFAAGTIGLLAQQPAYDEDALRAMRHATPEWAMIAPHLPDPQTGTPEKLAQAADVLRARRLQEDALDYYRYALKRGGDQIKLENDIGVTLLELNRFAEARVAFKYAVKAKPKYAQGWNNLGAAEYSAGFPKVALTDYMRAVKLDKKSAVFHSNLGTAYFELKDYESARSEFERAVKLDPGVFQEGGWAGVQAHVLSTSDRARYCFEMAKMAARLHDGDNVVRWIARSSEAGFDVKSEMQGDKDFDPYRKDPRILMVIQNAKAIRSGQVAGLTPPSPDPAPQAPNL